MSKSNIECVKSFGTERCRCRACLNEWISHVLKTVRTDLALACDSEPKEYHWRYKSGIKMITDLLDDSEHWEALKQRWAEDDPGVISRLYDPPVTPNSN